MTTYNKWHTTRHHVNNTVDDISADQQRRKRVMMMMMRKNGEIIDKPDPRETTISTEMWLYERQEARREARNQ